VTAAPTDTTSLPSQLRLAVTRLARRLRQESAGDITLSQFSALATVERRGPLSLKALADVERVAPPSMTRIAGCLEDRGLVVRTVDTADRRVARLAITDSGRTLLDLARTRRDAYLAVRLGGLSPAEVDILVLAVPVLERLTSEEPSTAEERRP
jgi:DNA-binding MarR family transcriptional regulator